MWDREFDLSSIYKYMDAVIMAQDRVSYDSLMMALEEAGIVWGSGDKPTSLNNWSLDRVCNAPAVCYIVREGRIKYSHRRYVERLATENEAYMKKCFVYDVSQELGSFEASEDEIRILLNN